MLLRDVYQDLYGSSDKFAKNNLIELAGILSEIGSRAKPWTWRYLHGILNGYKGFSTSDDLGRALTILAGKLDNQSDIQARAHEIMVLTTNGIEPGSLVMGHSTHCPQCYLLFVPNHPRRIYCPGCRPPRGK